MTCAAGGGGVEGWCKTTGGAASKSDCYKHEGGAALSDVQLRSAAATFPLFITPISFCNMQMGRMLLPL